MIGELLFYISKSANKGRSQVFVAADDKEIGAVSLWGILEWMCLHEWDREEQWSIGGWSSAN